MPIRDTLPPLRRHSYSVESLIKQCDRLHITNTGERFRFTTLQSRYATFIELWDRGLKAREEGRAGPFANKRAAEPAKKRVEDRILHVSSFHDPVREIEGTFIWRSGKWVINGKNTW